MSSSSLTGTLTWLFRLGEIQPIKKQIQRGPLKVVIFFVWSPQISWCWYWKVMFYSFLNLFHKNLIFILIKFMLWEADIGLICMFFLWFIYFCWLICSNCNMNDKIRINPVLLISHFRYLHYPSAIEATYDLVLMKKIPVLLLW